MADPWVAAVAQLLEQHGIAAEVSRAGQAGDVIAIAAPADRFADVQRLSPDIRALGFRYVTLELMTSEGP